MTVSSSNLLSELDSTIVLHHVIPYLPFKEIVKTWYSATNKEYRRQMNRVQFTLFSHSCFQLLDEMFISDDDEERNSTVCSADHYFKHLSSNSTICDQFKLKDVIKALNQPLILSSIDNNEQVYSADLGQALDKYWKNNGPMDLRIFELAPFLDQIFKQCIDQKAGYTTKIPHMLHRLAAVLILTDDQFQSIRGFEKSTTSVTLSRPSLSKSSVINQGQLLQQLCQRDFETEQIVNGDILLNKMPSYSDAIDIDEEHPDENNIMKVMPLAPYARPLDPVTIDTISYHLLDDVKPNHVQVCKWAYHESQPTKWASYWNAGNEWWGCYGYTYYVARDNRLVATFASTSD